MLVRERMSTPVITVSPDDHVADVLEMMRNKKIRRAPVVQDGEVVGIVSDKDLFDVVPVLNTYLKNWEQKYLRQEITIDQVMKTRVITISETTPIEEAARIMADSKIGGLPVVSGGKITGIITETDLFKLFIELFGARDRGVRAALVMCDRPGEFAKLTNVIADNGGNFVAFSTYEGKSEDEIEVTVKVTGIDEDQFVALIQPLVLKIRDVRTV